MEGIMKTKYPNDRFSNTNMAEDYAFDFLENGKCKMVQSGDVVDLDEAVQRLRKEGEDK